MSKEATRSTRGPGRPKGSLTKRRALLVKIAEERNIPPLELMRQNMVYYYAQAVLLTDKVAKLIERERNRTSDQTNLKTLAKIAKMLAQIDDARMKAQRCAVDAARYTHPRLARVKVSDDSTKLT